MSDFGEVFNFQKINRSVNDNDGFILNDFPGRCGCRHEGWICTRAPHDGGLHVAGDYSGRHIYAVWETAELDFL